MSTLLAIIAMIVVIRNQNPKRSNQQAAPVQEAKTAEQSAMPNPVAEAALDPQPVVEKPKPADDDETEKALAQFGMSTKSLAAIRPQAKAVPPAVVGVGIIKQQ